MFYWTFAKIKMVRGMGFKVGARLASLSYIIILLLDPSLYILCKLSLLYGYWWVLTHPYIFLCCFYAFFVDLILCKIKMVRGWDSKSGPDWHHYPISLFCSLIQVSIYYVSYPFYTGLWWVLTILYLSLLFLCFLRRFNFMQNKNGARMGFNTQLGSHRSLKPACLPVPPPSHFYN